MHEYHLILKGTQDQGRADAFCTKVCDVSVYLAGLGDLQEVPDSGSRYRIAYHDACHLSNAQGVRGEPRELLRKIPGVEIMEIANGHLCCGSAGTYNVDQPQIAASLGQQKSNSIRATGADLVATGNIGCMTQIGTHLTMQGSPIPVRHTMQVIRDAYVGRDLSKQE